MRSQSDHNVIISIFLNGHFYPENYTYIHQNLYFTTRSVPLGPYQNLNEQPTIYKTVVSKLQQLQQYTYIHC